MRNHKLVPTTSSSSKNNTKQEQPHLSGAYIRSLVKQLSSSPTTRSKDHSTMGTKPHDQPQQEEQQAPQTTPSPQQQQQPHKKQVRRRLHTSRPYQERLLNMAEARREIVTALKIHRASMRQAKEQQQQQQQQQQLLQLQQRQEQQDVQVVHEQSQATRASAPMSYASFSDYLYNSPFANFTATSSYSSPLPYHTPVAPMVDGSDHGLDLLVPLPPQPLGLNLSFQDFNGVVGDDAMNTTSSFDPPFLQPSATSSYSVYSSPSVTMPSHDMLAVTTENTSLASDASLHRVLDDEEMAAIYSIGEQHDIEWSDTVNLVTSALWSELLESVEGVGDGVVLGQDTIGSVNTAEDALTHMPDWFSDSLGHQGTKDGSLSLL